ncbi:P-loop containing nucleoside triphosphate hydrolase protein [Dipodascopsis tothii]|uniref:P-loop containing nucleoside triphosphate hydrolase protein n=1 Tax=Dipodascopsis tothii TaxID=44089 RepID=UPI0034CF92E6
MMDGQEGNMGGRWGEQLRGHGVDIESAENEFEDLRRQLSATKDEFDLERQTSKFSRVFSNKDIVEEPAFDLEEWMRNDNEEGKRSGVLPKRIGVSFKNLRVMGLGSGQNRLQTFPDDIANLLGWGLFKKVFQRIEPPQIRTILHDFTGLVRPGEMMLVLGSPGSGTTTLLKTLTNNRESYVSVDGEVLYDGIDHETAKAKYTGEIVFNSEDDIHLSTMTVAQTLRFALALKTPKIRALGETRVDFVEKLLSLYGKMFGISHVMDTLVGGDAAARGVSGGERKRVSIAEVLANRAAIVAFDNSTRGLDSSTAVDYARSLRIITDICNSTTIVTLYQAGDGIYDEFDKVCLIDSGRQIFYGPANEAWDYFRDLGFEPKPNVSKADFLTSITSLKHRPVRAGCENTAPQSAEELEAAFKQSKYYSNALQELEAYHREHMESGYGTTKEFEEAVSFQKDALSSRNSPYTVSFFQQVRYLFIRQLHLQWQDQVLLRSKFFNSIAVSLAFGSIFFNTSEETDGAFNRGSVLFFSCLFNGWTLQVEAGNQVLGRTLANKHRKFGMYRPSALALGRILAELPLLTAQVSVYCVILYFMSNLARTPGQFFLHLLTVITGTFTMLAFYRAIGTLSNNFDGVLRVTANVLNALAFWIGYVKPAFNMAWWYRWFYYADFLVYTFSVLMANEFHGREMYCSDDSYIPDISGASENNRVCSLLGSTPGSRFVSGDDYIETAFGYKHSELWRNYGILIGYLIFFIAFEMIASEIFLYDTDKTSSTKLYVKSSRPQSLEKEAGNTEKDEPMSESKRVAEDGSSGNLFCFKNVNYTIPAGSERQTLLDDVQGFAIPGKLLALMGSSGAGKTTLLNAVSQRISFGEVTGTFILNGQELAKDYQRTTGFVEQQDLHEPMATVREALRFSARLRQPREVTLEDKYKYVESVIELLNMESIADAIIGHPGEGLSVEERKRVTIGVELAAKPKLLFLDEPTSGLDSEGAYSIVTFLKQLAAESGLGIICTIHQPSSLLFELFDDLLLLAKGGKTVYFGPIGDHGYDVVQYFEERGPKREPNSNPAEYILEVVGAGAIRKSNKDWVALWRGSQNCLRQSELIDRLISNQVSGAIEVESAYSTVEFAATMKEQLIAVTLRLWLTLWRTPSFGFTIVFNSIACGLCSGILFFQLGTSIIDTESRIFLMFFTLMVTIPIVNMFEIHMIIARDLYELRERNSKVYSWFALVFAYLVCGIPYAILSTVLFFPLFWYMPGLEMSPSIAGYGFFMTLLMLIWHTNVATLLGSFMPSISTAGVINPIFFVATHVSTGVMIPYPLLNGFYKNFMYWIDPSAWAIRGLAITSLRDSEIICAPAEISTFIPPDGLTCMEFAGSWLTEVGTGQLLNPNATASCEYCHLSSGKEYLQSIGIQGTTRWRDIGVYIAFVILNVILPFAVYYLAREFKWKRK